MKIKSVRNLASGILLMFLAAACACNLALSVAATLCGVLIAMFIIMLGVNLYYERRG